MASSFVTSGGDLKIALVSFQLQTLGPVGAQGVFDGSESVIDNKKAFFSLLGRLFYDLVHKHVGLHFSGVVREGILLEKDTS